MRPSFWTVFWNQTDFSLTKCASNIARICLSPTHLFVTVQPYNLFSSLVSLYLMVFHQFCQWWKLELVTQEHVAVLCGINEEVPVFILAPVGEHISQNPFTDPDQEVARAFVAQQVFCFLSRDYACKKTMPVNTQLFTFICGLDEYTFKQTVLFKLDKPSVLPESPRVFNSVPPYQDSVPTLNDNSK